MSSTATRRVVVTGLGVVSPLGNSAAAMRDALRAGRSGVAPLVALPPIEGRVVFGGECHDFTGEIDDFGLLEKDVKKSIRKALKVMCRESMMAVAAAQQCVADAGFATTPMDPDRSGVVFGSDYMLSPPDDLLDAMKACGVGGSGFDYPQWGTVGLKGMNPLWMLNYLPNMPGSHIAIFNDLRGPNNSLTMREASSLLAIREAAHTIQRGHADRMIAGATGTRIHSFKTLHALQTEQLADSSLPPEQACRPFDRRRTGTVVGEGAGAILLEEREAALARGAAIYGEIVSSGSAAVADDQLHGRAEVALAHAARSALAQAAAAGLESDQIGHISAHALGTTQGDAAEARALHAVLGERSQTIPVLAPKSYFGNLGGGGGLVETIASLLALDEERLYPTLNYAEPDPECPLSVATVANKLPPGGAFLKLSVTPQGQAVAIVVRR